MNDEDVSPELLAAHGLVCEAMMAIQRAVGHCPACTAREYRIVADQLEEAIEEALDFAEGAEHGAVH